MAIWLRPSGTSRTFQSYLRWLQGLTGERQEFADAVRSRACCWRLHMIEFQRDLARITVGALMIPLGAGHIPSPRSLQAVPC